MQEKVFLELDPRSIKQAVFLVGMPGIALVGKVAVKLIVDQYKAEKLLEIYPEDLPPRVVIP